MKSIIHDGEQPIKSTEFLGKENGQNINSHRNSTDCIFPYTHNILMGNQPIRALYPNWRIWL